MLSERDKGKDFGFGTLFYYYIMLSKFGKYVQMNKYGI